MHGYVCVCMCVYACSVCAWYVYVCVVCMHRHVFMCAVCMYVFVCVVSICVQCMPVLCVWYMYICVQVFMCGMVLLCV